MANLRAHRTSASERSRRNRAAVTLSVITSAMADSHTTVRGKVLAGKMCASVCLESDQCCVVVMYASEMLRA